MIRRSASSTRPLSLLREEKGLPLPSASRPSARGLARTVRRRWPLYLVLACVTLLLLGKLSAPGARAPATATYYPDSYSVDGLGGGGGGGAGGADGAGAAPVPVKLQQPPDELLMAEDDLALQVEDPVLSPEEQARATQDAAATAASREAARTQQLQALVWFLYHGGVLPASLDPGALSVPAWRAALADAWDARRAARKAAAAAEVGADDRFAAAHAEDEDEEPYELPELFPGNWAAEAALRTRVTVFSKSYCPYSRRGKGIIAQYDLDPPPFVVELDLRPGGDMDALQDALRALTGRRTVPNVVVDFESIGGSDELATLHGEGSLEKKLLRGRTKFVFSETGELEAHEIR